MKNLIVLLGLVLFVASCKAPTGASGVKLPKKVVASETNINEVLKNPDPNQILNILAPSYRDEQLGFLGGNVKQLLDELFCGRDASKEFRCPGFQEIQSIEILEIEDGDDYKPIKTKIILKSGEHLISEGLSLKKVGKQYLLVGAVG